VGSGKDVPVKRIGKININQMLVPLLPCILAMPNNAISELVSKPNPNITPRGYIFHGLQPRPPQVSNTPYNKPSSPSPKPSSNTYLSTILNKHLKTQNRHPTPLILNSRSSSPSNLIKIFNCCIRLCRT